jgi:hypothetical protein
LIFEVSDERKGYPLEQTKKIELKLTHNPNKSLPRTFFAYLYHVPLDADVSITQAERVLPITRNGDYVETRTWILPDVEVSIKVSREELVIASSTYLLHDDRIFEPVWENKEIDLIQITYM